MATALSDLRLAAQQRADRVNASTITTAEWTTMINYAAGALYGLLTSTYEDYNIVKYQFTLAGGDPGNTLAVGPGTAVPLFDKLRGLWRQVSTGATATNWAPMLRANSYLERNMYAGVPVSPLFGQYAGYYWLMGGVLEALPPASSAGTYLLTYVPAFTKLVLDTDTIDGSWMAANGIDQYIVYDAAAQALIKEESLDTAQICLQQRDILGQRILKEFATRDDNQPGRIVDVKRVRNNWGFGGYGMGGLGGP